MDIHLFLQHSKTYVQKEAAWMVSNIAAGSRNQIQALLNLKLITPLLDILRNGEFRVRLFGCFQPENR